MAIRYYFNFISPASFASHVIIGADLGSLPFERAPVFVPHFLMKHPDMMTPLTVSLERLEYDFEDLTRRVRPYGVDPRPGIELYWKAREGALGVAPEQAFDTFFACTGFEIAVEQHKAKPYVDRLFQAYWEEGRLITDADELASLAAEVGIDREPFASRLDSPALDERASQREYDFLHDGGFGVPLFLQDGVRYWGSDRLDWLLADLGNRPSPPGVGRWPRPFALPEPSPEADAPALRVEFCFACPYSYLALARLGALQGRIGELKLRASAWPEGGYSARAQLAKAAYIEEDAPRFARAYGLPFQSKTFELAATGARAAAAFALAEERGLAAPFLAAVFQAHWGEGRDIDDASVLASILSDAGLPEELAAAEPAAVTALSTASPVFGVPLLRIAERNYWGNDRLEMLLEDLAGGPDAATASPRELPAPTSV